MEIKNHLGWTFVIKGCYEKLTDELIKKLKQYNFTIYWNNDTCNYWMFDFKIGEIWFESTKIDTNNEKIILNILD